MFGIDDAIIAAVAPSVINGIMGSDAADNAVNAQTNSANQANATQLKMYNQNRQDLAPWRTTGAAAQNKLAQMLGLNAAPTSGTDYYKINPTAFSDTWHKYSDPYGYVDESHPAYQEILDKTLADLQSQGIAPPAESGGASGGESGSLLKSYSEAGNPTPSFQDLTKNFSMADFEADPGYGFRLSEGLKAIQNSAAARGGLLSGSALKGISRYGQDMASQEYGNAFARYNTNRANLSNEYSNAYNRYNQDQQNKYARLSGVSGMGESAAGQIAGLGANTAGNIAQNQIGVGNATAAAGIAGANSMSNAIGQGLNFYNQNQMINNLRRSGYGGNDSGTLYSM